MAPNLSGLEKPETVLISLANLLNLLYCRIIAKSYNDLTSPKVILSPSVLVKPSCSTRDLLSPAKNPFSPNRSSCSLALSIKSLFISSSVLKLNIGPNIALIELPYIKLILDNISSVVVPYSYSIFNSSAILRIAVLI